MNIKDEKPIVQTLEPGEMPHDQWLASRTTGEFIDHVAEEADRDYRPIISVIKDYTGDPYSNIVKMKALQVLEELIGNANINLKEEVKIDVPNHEVTYKGIAERFDGKQWELIETANDWLKFIPLESRVEIRKLPYRSAYAPKILHKNPANQTDRDYIHQLMNKMNKAWRDGCKERIFSFNSETGLFSVRPEPVNQIRSKKRT
jgi:hypothetical protein